VLLLPVASRTVHVTRLVPRLNNAGALLDNDATAQLSPTTGIPNATFVAVQPELADATTSAGQVIVGLVVSRTMTRCTQLLLLPLASRTVHVTSVVPAPKTAGALFVTETTAQLSPVTGVPSATLVAPHPELAETATSAGQLMVGLELSRTMTRCTQLLLLPA